MAMAGPLGAKVALEVDVTQKKKTHHTDMARIAYDPAKPQDWLKPRTGQALSYDIEGQTDHYLIPYWQVEDSFTCFPVIEPK